MLHGLVLYMSNVYMNKIIGYVIHIENEYLKFIAWHKTQYATQSVMKREMVTAT